jgi:hypothetical protein
VSLRPREDLVRAGLALIGVSGAHPAGSGIVAATLDCPAESGAWVAAFGDIGGDGGHGGATTAATGGSNALTNA